MKKLAHNLVSPRLGLVLVAFALLATSGFTCAKVTDPLGSSDTSGLAPGGQFGDPFPAHPGGFAVCVKSCTDNAKIARIAERQLHRANHDACAGDKECIKQENARHAARMQEINGIMQDCIAECHNQGGGEGGE